MSIYKPCDIRGPSSTLTPELYRCWGRSLGARLDPKDKFVVGGDVRATTPEFLAALAEGLCESGASVVDLGVLPTPMIYYAKRRLRAAGCAVVTASHNPAEQNGLKWMVGDLPPTPDEVESLRHAAQEPERLARRARGQVRTLDVTYDYVAWLQETWVEGLECELRVVLDPMHGCNAGRARRYLQAVFPRCLFSAVHDEPRTDLGGRSPNCAKAEALGELSAAVEHARADLGIAFDGDGDRVAFVDGDGLPLTAEEATCVLLESFGPGAEGESFVYDLKFSDRLAETARRLGATALPERSGHAFIRRRMLESGALFGAEISGHYFYRCLDGGDDALFSACWMISWLAQSGRNLAEQRRACPAVFITPDLRLRMDAERQSEALCRVRSVWSAHPQSSLDGVRIEFPDGWALVRSSVTEAGLTFRFEASGWGALQELVWRFCEPLGEVGEQLWDVYVENAGNQCSLG